MIRLTYLLAIFFTYFYPLNSQHTEVIRNFTDEDGKRQGHWETKYPDGNVRYRGYFIDDRPVGWFTRYFPNGNRMAVMYFCDEGLNARAELFYEDGNLAASGNYFDEKKDSIWRYHSFYGGHLTSIETYNRGVREGLSAVYYPDGTVAELFFYEDNLRNGPWRQYYDNGELRLDAEFENDVKHGAFSLYRPGGRIEITGAYRNNQMHGEWTFYDDSDQIISVLNYIDGRPENEEDLIISDQEMFRKILEMQGRIPEPDESELFFNRGL